jgi:hypothetical protein
VSRDTLFDVAGTTDPSGLDQLPLEQGIPVEVVVDAATCRVLQLTDRP